MSFLKLQGTLVRALLVYDRGIELSLKSLCYIEKANWRSYLFRYYEAESLRLTALETCFLRSAVALPVAEAFLDENGG